MKRLINILERKIGGFWAYFFLLIITWMLFIVFFSLIQINLINTDNHRNSKQWDIFLDKYFKGRIDAIKSFGGGDLNLSKLYDTEKKSVSAIGRANEQYDFHLLDLVSSTDFPMLNFLVSKRSNAEGNRIVTEIYPENDMNNLFYGAGINSLKNANFSNQVTWDSEFSYGFIFLESRYYIFILDENNTKDTFIYLYDLNSVLMNYLEEYYSNNFSRIEIQSRFLTKILHDASTPNLHISSFHISWERFGLPVRYTIDVPITLAILDFNWIILNSGIVNFLLYLFLFFHSSYEKRKNWRNNKNNRFSQFIDGSADSIFLTDIYGKILHCNKISIELLGEGSNKIIGVNIKDILFYDKTSLLLSSVDSYKYNLKILTTLKADKKIFNASVSLLVFKEIGEVLISIQDVTSEYEKEKKLEYNASYDTLTGFLNRDSLIKYLDEYFSSGYMTIESAVFFIDLDGVKYVNDSLGNSCGDELIKRITERFIHILYFHDKSIKYFRFGGDKFIIFIEDVSELSIDYIANDFLNESQNSILINDQDVYISYNIGIAKLPSHAEDGGSLLRNLELAIAHSKNQGKNNYSIYNDEIAQVQARYKGLSDALERAVLENEFTLFYQPIICLKSETVVFVEALLRWNSRQFGNVPPAEFIPIAERTGVINKIGPFIYKTATRQINEWVNTPLKNIKVSINISPVQFRKGNVFEELNSALNYFSLDSSMLHVELTENSIIEDEEISMSQIKKLKESGFHLSIDDFGTGYSSLSYLNKDVFSTIKIDMSFIRGLPYEEKDAKLTLAMISLGHSLGLNIIAEGVENKEQLEFLRSNNCDFYQGYYATKPLSSTDFKKWYLNYIDKEIK